MRTITVISTRGQKMKKYESAARTWGELTSEIGGDYDLSGLKAVENINKTTLGNIDSVLPEGPHRIFLRPEKTKSGVDFSTISFAELRKKYVQDNPAVIEFLSDKYNKNWTRMGTAELREGLTEYFSSETAELVEEDVTQSTGICVDTIVVMCDDAIGEVTELEEEEYEFDSVTSERLKNLFRSIKTVAQGGIVEDRGSASPREKTPEEIELEEAMAEFREMEEGNI